MIIEMRTYTLQPGTVASFEERFAQALPARAKVSPLAAFWHTEVGPLNRVIHVWPYEDMAARTRLREQATKTPGWPPNTREFVVEQQSDFIFPPRSRRRSNRASWAALRDPHLHLQTRRHPGRDRPLERAHRAPPGIVAIGRCLVERARRAQQMVPYLGL